MNASEDFLLLLVQAHVVAAAKVIQALNPNEDVTGVTKLIIANFVHLPRLDDTQGAADKCDDGVHLYATELMSLGLLWHGFHDAISEGNGERMLQYWKFLLIIFKTTNHHNYAKKAVNLMMQYYCTFSERKKAELLWGRCVNRRGYTGTNIPCDLFMEHLNRMLKTVIRAMGANVNLISIERAGKADYD